ncbi:MAG: pyrroloquinoline quinone-dependent dehydrogenase [Gammaproteobacteria bacterium]|nr:pyrroloquinoline quinone-dependent dehydrogenase [Gammaproteobacteria bacterium]MDD9959685.1 pyrroloquinoline quinone-dependent dehydrogenase [Gammaproteobacteria bacterium]
MKSILSLSISLLTAAYSSIITAQNVDWPSYGGDNGSTKYVSFDQISADNVSQLSTAWSWESVDNATAVANIADGNSRAVPGTYKATPIVIDGIMYLPTSFGRVVSLDAQTGAERWVFDTQAWEAGRPPNLGYNTRGVAYWEGNGKRRILFATNDSYLWSLNADDGQPDPGFGDEGRVDLSLGLGREIDKSQYGVVSPVLVTNDKAIVNSIVNDGPSSIQTPPGHIRAFNPESGELEWMFRTIPQAGEFGNETWEDGSWEYSGSTNSWTIMSADDELGIAYIPTGTPTNDWYGGMRKGDNLFAESLVALDVNSGERIWHFQMVHHGVWDYDLPAAPTLIDINVAGRDIKAVAQISKQGFTYVFDRVTGEPVWPIEERPVPQSSVPGEQLSATQPFPTKPPPFEPQGISDETLIDFTPALRQEALQNIERYDYGPLFEPPSLRGTIQFPGWAGGGEWRGAAFDPETGMYYVPSASGPIVVQIIEARRGREEMRYVRGGARGVAGPSGLPLTKPPYGRITAIDMNSGENAWIVPHGEGIRQQIIDMGILDPGPVGTVDNAGPGPLLTRTLLYMAQRDNDRNLLRAYNKATGEIVHEYELPLPPTGTPMSYMINGKQFISIALGGGQDARIVALALP